MVFGVKPSRLSALVGLICWFMSTSVLGDAPWGSASATQNSTAEQRLLHWSVAEVNVGTDWVGWETSVEQGETRLRLHWHPGEQAWSKVTPQLDRVRLQLSCVECDPGELLDLVQVRAIDSRGRPVDDSSSWRWLPGRSEVYLIRHEAVEPEQRRMVEFVLSGELGRDYQWADSTGPALATRWRYAAGCEAWASDISGPARSAPGCRSLMMPASSSPWAPVGGGLAVLLLVVLATLRASRRPAMSTYRVSSGYYIDETWDRANREILPRIRRFLFG